MSIQSISKTTIPQGQDCPICLEGGSECVKTVCEHFFHKQCLDIWLAKNTTCPICRRVIQLQSRTQDQLSLQEQFPFFM